MIKSYIKIKIKTKIIKKIVSFLVFIGLMVMNIPHGIFATNVAEATAPVFNAEIVKATAGTTFGVRMADFDADGDNDITVANSTGMSIILNNGNGTFADRVDYGVAQALGKDVTTADFDGDSDIDVAVANSYNNADYGNRVMIFLNNGNGTFAAGVQYLAGTSPRSIETADFDGDSDYDLVIGTYSSGATLLKNNGNGTFAAYSSFAYDGWNCYNVRKANIDGDGDVDVMVLKDNAEIGVYKNNGSAVFSWDSTISASYMSGDFQVADIDGDNDIDIVAHTRISSVNYYSTSLNNGSGSFGALTNYATGYGPTYQGRRFSLVDIDGDNDRDIVNVYSSGLYWLQNNGSGVFAAEASLSYATSVATGSVYYGDLNGGGGVNSDLILADTDATSSIRIVYNAIVTNTAPSITSGPSFSSQAIDGSGDVTFTTTVSDADSNDTKMKVEYSDDGGSTWYDPDLVSATPDGGTVDLDDANAYQIGTSNAIDTSGGAKTLTVVWDTLSASNGNGSLSGTSQSDIQIRVTANDATADSTATASASFSVDNAVPTISSRQTADLDGDGYIDAMHITFDGNIKDSSVSAGNFAIAGASGLAFSSTTNGDTADDGDIYITFTDGVLASSSTAAVTYTAGTLTDAYGNALATTGAVASSDTTGPAILSATAGDGAVVGIGIDNDDIVTITFSENTNQPVINAGNINTVLALNNGHTWLDGAGAIGGATWSDAATLVVDLSVGTSVPTVAISDTVTLNGTTITDGTTNSSTVAFSSITGSFLNDNLPTLTINSVAEKIDASGAVDISVEIDDADLSDTLSIKAEYSNDGGCADGSDPTLDTGNVTADSGTPVVNNVDVYQIGSISVVDVGTNTVQFDWSSRTDDATADGTYCVKLTPYDGLVAGTPATQTFTIDNVSPSGMAGFSILAVTTSSAALVWTNPATDTNFDHYEIWYGENQSDVQGRTGTATEWDNSDDADLATSTTADTSINVLNSNTGYYFKIWAIDDFGNYQTLADETGYTYAAAPGTPTVTASAVSGLNVLIDQNSNSSATEYAIKVGAQYTQADGTLGDLPVWKTYAQWGGASGKNLAGLSANTQYTVSVKARNGDLVETAFSGSVSKYTFANAVSGVSLVNASTKTTYGMTLTWTNNGQNGVKIDLSSVGGGACDATYDIGDYDNVSVNPASPRAISASANTCYKVRIGSYNADGVLNTVDYVYSSDLRTPPAQPTGLTNSAADDSSITWTWTAVTDATNYKIYLSNDTYVGETGGATNSYSHTPLSANTSYTVYVRAENANGEGIASSTASAYTDANAPTGAGHALASQTLDSMKWTWASGGAQKDFYAWMTSPVANSGYITDLFWTVSGTLSANTQYSFNVKARNDEDTETNSITTNAYTSQGVPTGMTFSAVGTDTITVTATGSFANLATGSSGIRFQNTTTSADNSFTVDNWTNSSLSPNTQYTYVVSAKNGDGDETSSVTSSKYTLAAVPGAPTINGPTTTTLNVTINANGNSSGTLFAIHETGTDRFVQADGTLGVAAVWQTTSTWGTVSGVNGKIAVNGLSVGANYIFEVKAKNAEAVETAYGTSASLYTLVEGGTAPTVDTPTANSLNITLNTGGNPADTTYKIYESSTAKYVQADSTLGVSEVWRVATDWGTITVIGLNANTQYSFSITPKSAGGVAGEASTATAKYTSALAPGVPTVTSTTATSLNVVIDENTNPSTTTYALLVGIQYVQPDGTLGGEGTALWQTKTVWGGASGYNIEGLSPNTSYIVSVKARNGNSEATDAVSAAAKYTLAATPGTGSVSPSTCNVTCSVTLEWGANGNPVATVYYVTKNGSSFTSTTSTNISDTFTATGTYTYTVYAKNEEAVSSGILSLGSATAASSGGGLIGIGNGPGHSTDPVDSTDPDDNVGDGDEDSDDADNQDEDQEAEQENEQEVDQENDQENDIVAYDGDESELDYDDDSDADADDEQENEDTDSADTDEEIDTSQDDQDADSDGAHSEYGVQPQTVDTDVGETLINDLNRYVSSNSGSLSLAFNKPKKIRNYEDADVVKNIDGDTFTDLAEDELFGDVASKDAVVAPKSSNIDDRKIEPESPNLVSVNGEPNEVVEIIVGPFESLYSIETIDQEEFVEQLLNFGDVKLDNTGVGLVTLNITTPGRYFMTTYKKSAGGGVGRMGKLSFFEVKKNKKKSQISDVNIDSTSVSALAFDAVAKGVEPADLEKMLAMNDLKLDDKLFVSPKWVNEMYQKESMYFVSLIKGTKYENEFNKSYLAYQNEYVNEGKRVLTGHAAPGKRVVIAFRSATFASVVIADKQTGYFESEVPNDVKKGDHVAYIYSVDDDSQEMSSVMRMIFRVYEGTI